MKNHILSHCFILCFFLSLNSQGQSKSVNTDCEKVYNDSFSFLERFSAKGNVKDLDTALAIVDNSNASCAEDQFRFSDLKIQLFLLSKNYSRGYKFVKDSIDVDDFASPYQKNMYLNTFLAIKAEKNNNRQERNKYYKLIAEDILKYVKNKPDDMTAWYEFYLNKAAFTDREKLIKEIEDAEKKYASDTTMPYWKGIIQTIRNLPANF